jgi:hypothetical protein
MSQLNSNPNLGYKPQNQSGSVPFTVSYEPAAYNPDITAVHTSGKVPDQLYDATQQAATELTVGQDGDNFLGSSLAVAGTTDKTVTDVFTVVQNPAQAASEGLSLSPQHE